MRQVNELMIEQLKQGDDWYDRPFDFDPYHRRAGIGVLIADKASRKKGNATMALTCLIEYCFKTLLLHQLYCNILENNHESLDLFKKLGFMK